MWENLKKARETGSGGLFIKLKDGDSVEGVFAGEPYAYYQIFKDKREYPTWAEGRSFKFRINFLCKQDGRWVPKIFQGGAMLRDMLLDAVQEYTDECVYKIKRTGSTKDDTRYAILFKSNLTDEDKTAIAGVKLLRLTREEASVSTDLPPPDDSDIPF